ncbi:MAG: oligosaccharide flippase family protein [Planctomycetota bacterium]
MKSQGSTTELTADPEPAESGASPTFLRSALTLSSASAVGQALPFLVSPVLTRLFAPEHFGLAGVYLAMGGLFAVAASLRYELAIVLPEKEDVASSVTALSILCALTFAVVVGGIFALDAYLPWASSTFPIWVVALVPPLVLSSSLVTILNQFLTRYESFGALARSRLINTFFGSGAKLGAGIAGFASAWALVGATVLAQAMTVVYLLVTPRAKRLSFRGVSARSILLAARQYRNFPYFAMGSGFLVELSLRLPLVFLAFEYSSRTLGFFVFAQMILRLPMGVVARSIGQVLVSKAARAESGALSSLVGETFRLLVALGTLPILLLGVAGAPLFSFVFGSEWAEAGLYSQVLSLAILVEFVTAPLNQLFNVLERQKQAFRLNLVLFAIRVAALAVGIVIGGVLATLACYAVADIAGRWIKFRYITGAAGFPASEALGQLLRGALRSVPFVLAVVAAYFYWPKEPVLIFAVSCVSSLAYFAYLYKLSRELDLGVLRR